MTSDIFIIVTVSNNSNSFFPHIAIDGEGHVGAIARPGRAGRSCACGALKKCLMEFQAEGYARHCKTRQQGKARKEMTRNIKAKKCNELKARKDTTRQGKKRQGRTTQENEFKTRQEKESQEMTRGAKRNDAMR